MCATIFTVKGAISHKVEGSWLTVHGFFPTALTQTGTNTGCFYHTHNRHNTMPNARVLRDIKARKGVAAHEIIRRAYLMVARNETLSPQIRHHAQLQLNTFGRYTQPTTVRNRCHESGRGRGIISEFALSRVWLRSLSSLVSSSNYHQFQFRLKALNGDLPGVQKASW